ncbi:MAG: hypothetical protein AAF958_16365 [Planctomycetota bacterium]
MSAGLNPYRPPESDHLGDVDRAACPVCQQTISWQQIAFSSFPVFITCRQCSTRLVGRRFVVVQAIVLISVPILVVGLMPLLVFVPAWKLTVYQTIVTAVVLASALACLNVPITRIWGRYRVRD